MITYVAFGSRGDVVPLLALCIDLPYPSTLITHVDHATWIDTLLLPTVTTVTVTTVTATTATNTTVTATSESSVTVKYVQTSPTDTSPTPHSLILPLIPPTTTLLVHTLFSLEAFHISESLNLPSLILQPHSLPPHHLKKNNDWTYILTSPRWSSYRTTLNLPPSPLNLHPKIIYLFPPKFSPTPTNLCSGFLHLPTPSIPLNPSLTSFLTASTLPKILITFGSMSPYVPIKFISNFVPALLLKNVAVVLCHVRCSLLHCSLFVEDGFNVNFEFYMERFDAVIHHGGMGTVGICLKFSKKQVRGAVKMCVTIESGDRVFESRGDGFSNHCVYIMT